MSFIPKAHEIYKHFKGNLYQIVAVAEHTETGEALVIYQALYGDFRIYARPLDMFISPVDREKYPQVQQIYRFELQGEDRMRQHREMEAGETSAKQATSEENDLELGNAHEESAQQTTKSYARDDIELNRTTTVEVAGTMDSPEEEFQLDPMVLEFLDADSYESRLNILAGLHHRITDEMITTMAIACDIEVDEGDIEERYEGLRSCLLMLERYECNRLR